MHKKYLERWQGWGGRAHQLPENVHSGSVLPPPKKNTHETTHWGQHFLSTSREWKASAPYLQWWHALRLCQASLTHPHLFLQEPSSMSAARGEWATSGGSCSKSTASDSLQKRSHCRAGTSSVLNSSHEAATIRTVSEGRAATKSHAVRNRLGLGLHQGACVHHTHCLNQEWWKVGMTTAYGQSEVLIPKAERELYSGQQHASALRLCHPLSWPCCCPSYYFLSCSKHALFKTAWQQICPERSTGSMAKSRGMRTWIRKKEQQEKFPDSLHSAVGITSQRKWQKINHSSHLNSTRQNTAILHSHQKLMNIPEKTCSPLNLSLMRADTTRTIMQMGQMCVQSQMVSLAAQKGHQICNCWHFIFEVRLVIYHTAGKEAQHLPAPTLTMVRYHPPSLLSLHLPLHETSLKRTKVEGVLIMNLPCLAYLLPMAHCFCNP